MNIVWHMLVTQASELHDKLSLITDCIINTENTESERIGALAAQRDDRGVVCRECMHNM